MSDHLTRPTVLVLNRNWQAIHVKSASQAFAMMATDVATAIDIDGASMIPVKWNDWIKLPVRSQDDFAATPRHKIRIPTVIVLGKFSKVPSKKPKFSPRAVKERDQFTCQYCGHTSKDHPNDFNMDHVIPRSRKGKTEWSNIVTSCIPCNSKKADRTPEEAGMRLRNQPVVPKEITVTQRIVNTHGVPDWDLFAVRRPNVQN